MQLIVYRCKSTKRNYDPFFHGSYHLLEIHIEKLSTIMKCIKIHTEFRLCCIFAKCEAKCVHMCQILYLYNSRNDNNIKYSYSFTTITQSTIT